MFDLLSSLPLPCQKQMSHGEVWELEVPTLTCHQPQRVGLAVLVCVVAVVLVCVVVVVVVVVVVAEIESLLRLGRACVLTPRFHDVALPTALPFDRTRTRVQRI